MSNFTRTRAIVIEEPRKAVLREIALTRLTPDTIVTRTTMSAISSGTDMKTWRGEQHHGILYYPLVPGYESVGVVEHAGSGAGGRFKAGDRVMINECRKYGDVCAAWGGNSLHTLKNSETAFANDGLARIPDNVSDTQAVLAYLACVSLKGIEKTPIKPLDTVLVVGAGMVGIGALQIVKILHPATRVICMEIHPFRAEIARHHADHVILADGGEEARLLELTNGRKADVIIECSGNPTVVPRLHEFIKDGGWTRDAPGGHIHLQADYPTPVILNGYHRWFTKNMSLSMTCAIYGDGKDTVLRWMSEGRFRTDTIPVEVWPVGKCSEAYAYYERKKGGVFKILFDWTNA